MFYKKQSKIEGLLRLARAVGQYGKKTVMPNEKLKKKDDDFDPETGITIRNRFKRNHEWEEVKKSFSALPFQIWEFVLLILFVCILSYGTLQFAFRLIGGMLNIHLCFLLYVFYNVVQQFFLISQGGLLDQLAHTKKNSIST